MHLINPGKWLREMFPEQTKTLPSIIVWTFVYFVDVALVFFAAAKMGISFLEVNQRSMSVLIGVLVAAAFVLWWMETAVYNKIVSAVRKK